MTVDDVPTTDSTPTDSLNIAHVIVRSTSNQRISIPIKVETTQNTEPLNALSIVEQKDCSSTRKLLLNGEKRKYNQSKYETSTEP
jgi:hypothetical protein